MTASKPPAENPTLAVDSLEIGPFAPNPWAKWRQLMPIAQDWSYFDHAAVGPLSAPASRAMHQFVDQAARLGDTVWPEWAANIETLRRSTAELVGAQTSEICMVPNTTSGINLVAEGWPWQAGDNIVIPDHEFPSNLFPWMNQQSKGVELKVVPLRVVKTANGADEHQVHIDDLMSQVDTNTRMIALSWVGYASGYRIDLDSLVARANDQGVRVFLDAIQALGIYPLDVKKTPVDFLAADGHKWLLGPEGAGVAMIRREHQDKIRCLNVGWASVKNSYNYAQPAFDLRDTAARFESGSANMAGIAALAANVEMFLKVREAQGDDAIAQRIIQQATRLHEMLAEIGVPSRLPTDQANRSGIVTFDVPGVEPAAVRRSCLEQNVVLSCRGGGVRASVHAYNNDEDLHRLVDVIQSVKAT